MFLPSLNVANWERKSIEENKVNIVDLSNKCKDPISVTETYKCFCLCWYVTETVVTRQPLH